MAAYVRIVSAPNNHGGASSTHGTKVYVGETEIKGVCKIELSADINDVWRAVLHVSVIPPDVVYAEAEYKAHT